MAGYFVDSSALVKRYVNETGSVWLSGLVAPSAGNDIYIARITTVEVIAALTRRARGEAGRWNGWRRVSMKKMVRKSLCAKATMAFLCPRRMTRLSYLARNTLFVRRAALAASQSR